MMAIVASLGFVSCTDNNDNESVSLEGKWFILGEEHNELLIIDADHSVVSIGNDDEDMWMGIEGQITLDGNRFSMIFSDGDNSYGTYSLSGDTLTLDIDNDGVYVYKKLTNDFSMVGEWEYANLLCFINARKDVIELPAGSTVDGEPIINSIATSQVSGEFVEWALSKYFNNVNFKSENELEYTVVKDDESMVVTKNYTLENNIMTIDGLVGNTNFATSFMVFQNRNGSSAHLLLTKENMATMYVGYAHFLRADGTTAGSDEALEVFRNAFMEAFENYAIIITLNRK